MFETFRNAWKIDDLRKRLLFTFLILVLFRLGCAIPVPYITASALSSMFAGGTGGTEIMTAHDTAVGDAELYHQFFFGVVGDQRNVHGRFLLNGCIGKSSTVFPLTVWLNRYVLS